MVIWVISTYNKFDTKYIVHKLKIVSVTGSIVIIFKCLWLFYICLKKKSSLLIFIGQISCKGRHLIVYTNLVFGNPQCAGSPSPWHLAAPLAVCYVILPAMAAFMKMSDLLRVGHSGTALA